MQEAEQGWSEGQSHGCMPSAVHALSRACHPGQYRAHVHGELGPDPTHGEASCPVPSHAVQVQDLTCMSCITRPLSSLSSLARALMYSPRASCVKATLPPSNRDTTASAWPDWFSWRR